MKTVKLGDLERGSLFDYGGIKWAVLDFYRGLALCISADFVCREAFDKKNRNNFADSTLRVWMNGEFISNLVECGADISAFVDLEIDLTSNDGLRDYGLDRAKIGLISCDMYRQYRNYIPEKKNLWWTCTPWSTERGSDCDKEFVCLVLDSGGISEMNAKYSFGGVRPICIVKCDTMVRPVEH